MATYDQRIRALARGYRSEERALARDPAYGRIGIYKPIVNILIKSVNELNLNKQTIERAVQRGTVGQYISDHKEYIKDQVIKNVRALGDKTYDRFERLLKLIAKYEKTVEKQDKKIEKQEKKIGGLEARLKKIDKTAKINDERKEVARDYAMSTGPMPNRATMRFLRGR